MAEKKKYKIVNGKRVRDYSGFGPLGKLTKKALKIITRSDGFDTYSKKDLKNIRDNKQSSTTGNPLKKLNPNNEQNKKIRKKKANMTKENAGKTKAQIAALKRKRDDKTVASVNADNKKKMRDAASKRNEKFKKTGKSTVEERRAAAKKRMQEAARKRNAAFKNARKLKIAKKKNPLIKKDKYKGISTI